MKNDLKVDVALQSKKQIWKERFWGVLPLVLLSMIVVVLLTAIQGKSSLLRAEKEGLQILEGKQIAFDNIDKVLPIMQTAKNSKQAVKALQETLKLSKSQAQTIAQMSLSDFTIAKQGELKNSIAQVKASANPNKELANQAETLVNVVAMKLTRQSIHDQLSFPGTVEPWLRLNVLAEVGGKVISKRVKDGDWVRKGKIIAKIDPEKYRNYFLSSKAQYESALSNLKRQQELYKEELTTRSQLDQALTQVENFKAAMNNAEKDLENCSIRAPISGYANTVSIEKGQYINHSSVVASIIQINSVKVKVGIPESDVDAVRKIKTFNVKIDALEGKVFTGRKHHFSRSADSGARLYNLEIAVKNTGFQILPDMFARVEIIRNQRDESIVIPIYSMVPYNKEQVVYVANGETALRRKVEIGIQEGWNIEVKEGLQPGDNLIVVGHRQVSDGQKINITRTIADPKELLL